MLLLFKPFCCFYDLYDGISWENSYETCDFSRFSNYVENIQEMHIGLEKEESRNNDDNNENSGDTVDDPYGELEDDEEPITLKEVDLNEKTTEALDIIKNSTNWLQESTSTQPIMQPVFNTETPLPPTRVW